LNILSKFIAVAAMGFALVNFSGCQKRDRDDSEQKDSTEEITEILAPQDDISLPTDSQKEDRFSSADFAILLLLSPFELDAKNVTVTHSPNGSDLLVVNAPGQMPTPSFQAVHNSSSPGGKIYQFSELAYTSGSGVLRSGLFVKRSLRQSEEVTERDVYARRLVHSNSGNYEAVLVPLRNHVKTRDGALLFKIGSSALDARTGEIAMQFSRIEENTYRLWSLASSGSFCSGSIFWSEKSNSTATTQFLSTGRDSNTIYKWERSGSFLKLVGRHSTAALPKSISKLKPTCYQMTNQDTPGPVGLDTLRLDYDTLLLAETIPTAFQPNDPSLDSSAMSELQEMESIKLSLDDLQSGGTKKPASQFKPGTRYQTGDRVQIENGTIQEILRTNTHVTWFSSYYTYEATNVTSDKDGKIGRIAYTLDSHGRITSTRHIRSFAAQVSKDLSQNPQNAKDSISHIAKTLDRNRHQLDEAEKIAEKVDSFKKLFVITLTNYLLDRIGDRYGGKIFDKSLGLNAKLSAAAILTGSNVGLTAITDWITDPVKSPSQTFEPIFVSALTMGTALGTAAIGNGDIMAAFISGAFSGSSNIILNNTKDYDGPSLEASFASMGIASISSAARAKIFEDALKKIHEQNLAGAAAKTALQTARSKTQLIQGATGIADLYINDNLTVSSVAGKILTTIVSAIPADDRLAIPKALAVTLTKELDALGQLGESIVRNKIAEKEMDEVLSYFNNKESSKSAVNSLIQKDPKIFDNLDRVSNNNRDGIPSSIIEIRSRSANH
jgi:hypothetical protein